jgi:hypothetical protein
MTQPNDKECAFCPHSAKLSAEHIWSEWMRSLFPGKKFRFISRDERGAVVKEWASADIDMTAKVVCQKCNNDWMSSLESTHAKPAMADLIVGSKELTISQEQAKGIAAFAFKTTLIADHMKRDRKPFFSREVRHKFAKSLNIPPNTQMWMAGFLPMSSGHIHSCYHEGKIDAINRVWLDVCTYAVGHLAFQVVSCKCTIPITFRPITGFESIAAQFWPTMPDAIHWPPQDVLRTKQDFDAFSNRWRSISP